MSPAHRKPPTLKLLSGSREPVRPQVDLPLCNGVPSPPDWLDVTAAQEFDRLARILHVNGMLTEASLSALAVLSAIFGQIVRYSRAGEIPTGHLLAQYRGLAGDFGLTPAAASRLTPGDGDKKKENRFSKNGKRPAR